MPILIPLLLDRFLFDGWNDGLASDLRLRLAADFIDWEDSPQRFNAAFVKLYEPSRYSKQGMMQEAPSNPQIHRTAFSRR